MSQTITKHVSFCLTSADFLWWGQLSPFMKSDWDPFHLASFMMATFATCNLFYIIYWLIIRLIQSEKNTQFLSVCQSVAMMTVCPDLQLVWGCDYALWLCIVHCALCIGQCALCTVPHILQSMWWLAEVGWGCHQVVPPHWATMNSRWCSPLTTVTVTQLHASRPA